MPAFPSSRFCTLPALRRPPPLVQFLLPLLLLIPLFSLPCALAQSRAHAQPSASAWTRLEMPHFTVLSETSPADTLRWSVEFEQFHRGLGQVLQLQERALQPVTVVLFRSAASLRLYQPLENGKPAKLGGYFSHAPNGNFIALAPGEIPALTRLLIFHEGTHWLTNVSPVPMPLWLNEGLAEVYSTFSVSQNTYSYGAPLSWHVARLNHGWTMPLKELLQVQNGSLLFNEGHRTNVFYAEAWAFVHYLLFSHSLALRPKFNELTQQLVPGRDPDLVFQKVFARSCAEMDHRLADYLRSGAYTPIKLPFDRSALEREARLRPATPAEVEFSQSSLLVSLHRSAEALPRLQPLLAQMPNHLGLFETIGLASAESHHPADALYYLDRAAALGSKNSFVYSELGDATFPSDVRRAIDYYHRSLLINPRNQRLFEQLAIHLNQLDTLTAEDQNDINLGGILYPADPAIQVGLAVSALKQGRTAEGIVRLKAVTAANSSAPSVIVQYARSLLPPDAR